MASQMPPRIEDGQVQRSIDFQPDNRSTTSNRPTSSTKQQDSLLGRKRAAPTHLPGLNDTDDNSSSPKASLCNSAHVLHNEKTNDCTFCTTDGGVLSDVFFFL